MAPYSKGQAEPKSGKAVLSAHDRAYHAIQNHISVGRSGDDERLKAAELGKLCDVSPTPIRDALKPLEAGGVFSITPNAGAIAAIWSTPALRDLFTPLARIEDIAAVGRAPVDHAAIARVRGAVHGAVV